VVAQEVGAPRRGRRESEGRRRDRSGQYRGQLGRIVRRLRVVGEVVRLGGGGGGRRGTPRSFRRSVPGGQGPRRLRAGRAGRGEALKRAVFAQIGEAAAADCLIATSSSGLSITAIQRDTRLPERTLAAHPYNPPHLIPLVELAAGDLTGPAVLEQAAGLYRSVGKQPVIVGKDLPGYIANRMSAALWREAIELVRTGVASVEDVDRAVMGPHLIYHLGGGSSGIRGHISHLTATKEEMLRDLASWTTFPADTAELLAAGVEAEAAGRSLAELESERDEALAAVLLAMRDSLIE
jgi:hypothetical protein